MSGADAVVALDGGPNTVHVTGSVHGVVEGRRSITTCFWMVCNMFQKMYEGTLPDCQVWLHAVHCTASQEKMVNEIHDQYHT